MSSTMVGILYSAKFIYYRNMLLEKAKLWKWSVKQFGIDIMHTFRFLSHISTIVFIPLVKELFYCNTFFHVIFLT